MNLSQIDLTTLIIWVVVAVIALAILKFLWPFIKLAVGLLFAAIAGLFILDKLQGGTAFQQVADNIANWLKQKYNL